MKVKLAITPEPKNGKKWPQLVAVVCSSLLAVNCGFNFGWPSPSILKMLSNDLDFKVNEDQITYIIMLVPLGYLIGSPLGGLLLDYVGRKYTLLLLSLPQIINWILIANSTNVPTLYTARLFSGIGDGALFTTLPVYMGEILQPSVRGAVSASFSIGISLGFVAINCYGSYLSIRTAAYVSLTIPVIFLLTFTWMPKSPYYLLMKERVEDARNALKRLRRFHNVEDELSSISADVQRQISESGQYQDIFSITTNLKAFLILIGLRTFQQLTGISVVGFYTQYIFNKAGGMLSPAEATILCSAVQLLFMILAARLLDRFGRKPLFIFSSLGASITLIVLGIYFTLQEHGYNLSIIFWLPITDIMLYYIITGIGVVFVPNIMAGELLSVSVKSKALGLINIYLGLAISFVTILFQRLQSSLTMSVPFYVLGACALFSALFCWTCVPETKNKTLEQIQQNLNRTSDSPKKTSENISISTA